MRKSVITSPEYQNLKAEKDILLTEKTSLEKLTANLNKRVEEHEAEKAYMVHCIKLLQQALFGKSSEKLDESMRKQLSLVFNEAEEQSIGEQAELELESDAIEVPAHQRKKKGRTPLPKNLPRHEKVYELSGSELKCDCESCDGELEEIGDIRSEQLNYVPARLEVIDHIRKKYACKKCESCVKVAPGADKVLAKGQASAGLLSHILVSKYADHQPLYRQSEIWSRSGIDLPRSTLSNWVINCGEILKPLIKELKADIVKSDYVSSDETKVNVLNVEKSQCYMWVHLNGEREQRAVVYEYQDGRSGCYALEFLKNFNGYHQSDAYAGYDELHNREEVNWVACWAHARRKFMEIVKVVKKPGVSSEMVKRIGRLYRIEKKGQIQGLDPGQMRAYRQKHAKPLLDDMKKYLQKVVKEMPPSFAAAKAVKYVLNHWEGLIRYLDDGRLRIDNNDAERMIKPFALGRKNWLFSATERGAEASAVIYSLVQTCKENSINVFEYLRYALANIGKCQSPAEIRALLPYNVNIDLIKNFTEF